MPHIQIQFRRDTAASWNHANPILASGELGLELDTHQFKIGNGHSRWKDLPYGGIRGPPGPAGLILPCQEPSPGQVLTYVGGAPSAIQWRDQLSYNTTTVTIRAPMASPGTNFNFSSPVWQNQNIIPESFGSGYIGGGTDSDGFSIIMNPCYNMLNIPIITGTIAYWDPTASPTYGQMRYMQMKFGNSSTSGSLSIKIQPTTPITGTQSTLGAPLKLTISGVTSNAFTSVADIGTGDLNYAIIIYLQLNNNISHGHSHYPYYYNHWHHGHHGHTDHPPYDCHYHYGHTDHPPC